MLGLLMHEAQMLKQQSKRISQIAEASVSRLEKKKE